MTGDNQPNKQKERKKKKKKKKRKRIFCAVNGIDQHNRIGLYIIILWFYAGTNNLYIAFDRYN